MDSLMIGIKRFFKNKNTVTIICVIACLAILYFVYNWRIEVKTRPVSVPYATVAIGPRTYISSESVSTKKVPGGIVKNSGVIVDKTNIIGKYVSNDAVIPINGLFYNDMVVEWEKISETIYSDIPDGHTIVYLDVNKNTTYGNSIYPGNYIDLYYKGQNGSKVVIGKFIESIRVLAVTDGSGNNIFETASTPSEPKYLIFSVDEDLHLLLKKAIYTGADIFPVPRNASYSENPKSTQVVNAYIKNLILENAYNLQENTDDKDTKNGGNN